MRGPLQLQRSLSALLISTALLVLDSGAARAANQEPAGLNLGSTSFFDGFGRNEEGFTYLAYLQWASSRNIMDETGKPAPFFTDPEIDAFALVNQLAYTLPEKLFGDSAH